MKKIFILASFMLLGLNFSFAQEEAQKPTVLKPVYFDISPPLRDMVQKCDATQDNSWKEGVVKNKLNAFSPEGSSSDYSGPDPVRQAYFGNATTDTTIQNFDGGVMNGGLPPDTDGEVGQDHYFQVVNTKYTIFDKNGNKLLGPTNNSVIFTGLPNNSNDGDAVLLYDENADRWLFSQFSLPNYPNGPFFEMVAISQTSDPTGSWYRYQYSFTEMPDYPKLSVWGDGYYMTMHRFGGSGFISPGACAMDRTKMLTGDPTAAIIKFNLPSSAWGPLPADCDSEFPPDGTPCPFAYLVSTATASARIYNFHADWATPASSTFALAYTIPISPISTSGVDGNVVPQKGTSQKIDAMSKKKCMFRMPFRVFSDHWSMLINTTVNASGVAGIRWMELRNVGGTWSLYQEGTYAPADSKWRWMGSIAMDVTGSIALGYSISSSTMYPSIRYTGRLNGDPLGVMTIAEKGIINGGGSQTDGSGRWGDYSAMVADPSVPGKFWYTQEYYQTTSSASWKTRIASFSFSNVFSTVTTASPNPLCLGDSTQLNVAAYGGSGTYTYSWSSIPAGFTSTLQNPKAAPTDTTKYIAVTSDGTLSRQDTVQVNIGYKPTVFAGADTTVCWYVTSIPLHGTAINYKLFGWSSSGSGTFSSSSSLVTTYLPSLNDKISGSVDLKLVATSNAPCTGNVTSTKHVVFDVCTGIAGQNITEPGLLIQPNPAHGTVSIGIRGINTGSATLSITSMDGKILTSEVIGASLNSVLRTMDISGYARGIYFVQLKTGNKVITEKMVVQ
jgi:hypothetical protein